MRCKEFSSLLELQGLSPVSYDAQEHLAACTACQALLADFNSLVAVAKELPSEIDPPQRIWVTLRSQLEAEGLIKEPTAVRAEPSAPWFDNLRAWITPSRLAAAGIGLSLAIAAFLQSHPPRTAAPPQGGASAQIAVKPPSAVPQAGQPDGATPVPAPQMMPSGQGTQLAAAGKMRQPKPLQARPLVVSGGQSSPSQKIQIADQVGGIGLDGRGMSNPELDEALRTNLRTVNEFIAECEARLKKYPNDTLTREYLENAKQQKQELIGAILDSGRSEQ